MSRPKRYPKLIAFNLATETYEQLLAMLKAKKAETSIDFTFNEYMRHVVQGHIDGRGGGDGS